MRCGHGPRTKFKNKISNGGIPFLQPEIEVKAAEQSSAAGLCYETNLVSSYIPTTQIGRELLPNLYKNRQPICSVRLNTQVVLAPASAI